MASPRDREEFEAMCQQYPEIDEARRQFELSLESKAISDSVLPPAGIKEKILESIRAENESNRAKVVELVDPNAPASRKSTGIYWTVAACFILLAGCLGLIWFFYEKNKELQAAMASVTSNTDSLYQRSSILEEQLLQDKSLIQQSNFEVPQKGVPATITVYWDSASTDVYLVIKNVAPLPKGKHYELWSVTDGNYKSLGLFDAPAENKLILKMNGVRNADSFTITVR